MTAADLLSDLAMEGIELYAEGDKLRWHAPPGAVTASILSDLKTHKGELLRLLTKTARQQADELIGNDPDRRYQFEERAAITEIDGCLSREAAEQLALEEIRL